jgi:hypothetical protein
MFNVNINENADNPVWKHEFVYLTIPAGSTVNRINFPDVQNIRNVHLVNLETYTSETLGVNPNGVKVITEKEMSTMYLTLQLYNGKEFVHQMPLQRVRPQQGYSDNSAYFLPTKNWIGQKVNWPKSYIDFVNPTISEDARVIVFSVWYADVKSIEANDQNYEFKSNMK